MRLKLIAIATLLFIAPPTPAETAAHAGASVSAATPATRSAALPAALGIPAFRMTYQVFRNDWHIGSATFTLERDGGCWHFYSEAHASGIASWFVHSTFRESSRFTIVHGEIHPLAYSYTDSGRKDRDETIRFDWAAGLARDTRNGQTKTLAIAPGMLDRLSAQLEISRELAAGGPLADPYRIVNGGEINIYRLSRKKREEIAMPAGNFKTVAVVRNDPDSGRATRFWMAPDYAWLPVKMQQIEPGEATYSFVLDHLEWLPAKVNPQ